MLQVEVTDDELEARIYDPVGCELCRNLGFHSRIGIFEILRITDTIHELIIQKQTARQIRRVAIDQGMVTLQQSGWKQVKGGLTSLNEIMRYSKLGDEI